MTNNEANYDERLEPRREERDETDQAAYIQTLWRDKLSYDNAADILMMLHPMDRVEMISEIIDRLVATREPKFADPRFYETLDWEDIRWVSEA